MQIDSNPTLCKEVLKDNIESMQGKRIYGERLGFADLFLLKAKDAPNPYSCANMFYSIGYNMESDKMWICRIYSYKYGIDISGLIKRRLHDSGCKFRFLCEDSTYAEIELEESEREDFYSVLTEVILHDLAQFELADMINELEIEHELKREVLRDAAVYARQAAMRSPVRRSLGDYFAENDSLALEGFIMFRMHDTREIWERCIEKAAEDLALLEEQYELAALICELADMCVAQSREVILILRKGGGCTLIDENNTHIDYPDGLGIMNILFSISPEIINIYDLSGEDCAELLQSIRCSFPGKVHIFCSVTP